MPNRAMSLSLRARLWAPAVLLAVVILAMATSMTVRTQQLVAAGNAEQSARQAQLEHALRLQAAVQQGRSDDAGRYLAEIERGAQALGESAEVDKLRRSGADAPAYLAAADAYARLQSRQAEAQRAASGEARLRTIQFTVGVMMVMVLLVVASSALLVRSICPPLEAVQQVAGRIGRGDLSSQVPPGGGDEIGSVMTSLQTMQDALRRIVSEVREVADSIQVASREVAAGNLDLSRRTEQAGANLQRTASSMQVLNSAVQHSAESARQAHGLALQASEVADRGGQVVAEVVTTMQAIDQSSRRIADIVGTIDGIAFQTNILALNAAVEAARAGEQGRGFAVVAAEVRQLAGRSAAAAREVRSLIGTSVERVASGTHLVGDAGSTMGELVGSVQRVSGVVAEITQAADEQTQGVRSITSAVEELDEMTQRNAALVEQSAAAADSLKDQATRLARAVEVFRLGGAARHTAG
jgi:methyl-accepting chemotaxis protein